MPKLAPSSAMRRSQAAASPKPPPRQNPRIIASVGRGALRSASKAAAFDASYARAEAASLRRVANSEMSAPAMNVSSPAPRNTMTRTRGSAASLSTALGMACHMSSVIAFLRAGLSTSIQPMRSSMAVAIRAVRVSAALSVMWGPGCRKGGYRPVYRKVRRPSPFEGSARPAFETAMRTASYVK